MADYREGQRLQGSDGQIYVVVNGVPTLAAAPTAAPSTIVPPNPDRVAERARDEARKAEDQQMQRDAAARADRAAERADKTANRQAAASERAASAVDKPSEFQSKSAGFLGRMIQAEHDYGTVAVDERGGRGLARQALHNLTPGVENTLINSPGRQKADQAVENFIAASLRLESGAAISPVEFDRQYKIFFPAPGDSEEVLAQKADARRQTIEGFKIAAGPLADKAAGTMQTLPSGGDNSSGAGTFDPQMSGRVDSLINAGASKATIDAVLKAKGLPGIRAADFNAAKQWMTANKGKPYFGAQIPKPAGYEQSLIGQGMSGVNEGLASVAGGPVDLMTGALNLGATGINALANTDIPKIENPTMGSQWIKDKIGSPFIYAPTADPTQQFARRVGQSFGAAAVPAGMAGTVKGAVGQMIGGLSGGIGGATAQQVAPGNPYAEMAGELAGGGLATAGLAKVAQRSAQRGIEAAVPSIDQLKEQAGQLYRAAEARGVVAGPQHTQDLADSFRAALTQEGRVSPTGRISEVYPKAREAQQLIDDYAGNNMNPTQMQTVRKVAADGLSSPDPTERRLGSILTDAFDQWANPLAPELADARDVASRYLTAQQLTRARELAGARASQFTGSGFENALRTEYRGLDRGAIKGNQHFTDDVGQAIENVARGNPASNFFRGLGRLAPTGPVSGLGSIVPGLGIAAVSTPGVGAAVGGTMAGAGILGRAAATHMGIRAADQAELIARNGGALPKAQFATPEILQSLRDLMLAEAAKYQNP